MCKRKIWSGLHLVNNAVFTLTNTQLTSYKSGSQSSSCHRGNPLFLSLPTSPSGSLFFLTAFLYDSTKYMDALPTPAPPPHFPPSIFFSAQSSPPIFCLRDYDNGDFVLGIRVFMTWWVMTKEFSYRHNMSYVLKGFTPHWQAYIT